MADLFKILGQLDLDSDALTSLYKVPVPAEVRRGATQTLITSLIVCAYGGASQYDVRLRNSDYVAPEGGATDDYTYLIKDRSLGAQETDILSLGLVLPGDAEILIEAQFASKLSVNLLGIEIS